MIPSYYSKDINNFDNKRYIHRAKLSIPIATSTSYITLFTVPIGYYFYMCPVQYDGNSTGFSAFFNNLTTSGAFSVAFSTNGEYNSITSGVPTLVGVYTNGVAANSPRAFDIVAQGTTRIWQSPGTNFQLRYTNTTTAFTLAIIIDGFLVAA